jgi:hypothetical protein
MREMPVATWAGVGIKARAIVACARIGDRANYRTLLLDAPQLAADAARLAAEKVEA